MAQVNLDNKLFEVENIFCIGRNYSEHIKELNNERDSEITAFLKPTSSLLNAKEDSSAILVLPNFSENVHFETEVVLLVGANADQLSEQNALDIIAGIGIGLDLTARDTQNQAKDKGLPWLKSKGFKNSACISKFIDKQNFADFKNIEFSLKVNSQFRQTGNTANMLYSFTEILIYLAQVYGLQKGDLIFTGTPEGVGKLNSGDHLQLNLANQVQTEFKIK